MTYKRSISRRNVILVLVVLLGVGGVVVSELRENPIGYGKFGYGEQGYGGVKLEPTPTTTSTKEEVISQSI